jgi:hypothetical protein
MRIFRSEVKTMKDENGTDVAADTNLDGTEATATDAPAAGTTPKSQPKPKK